MHTYMYHNKVDKKEAYHKSLEMLSAVKLSDNLELSQDILVVSHGAALAIALAGLVDGDITKWQNYYFSNCSLTELHLDPKPTLGQLNSSAHLASLG